MSSSTSHSTVEATVRPVPRYGVFMVAGAVLGILVAGILTLFGSYEPSTALGVVYPPGQVFGFALLWTAPVGVALGGLLALVLDRVARKHTRMVRVERERVVQDDDLR
ncbi:potassium transporter Trk [Microbacterium sp. USHLN186]|uniref:potassium transporter Trk n=1 Tax=Microbacterium sp. USHLN186 TaxID=3081286 RepID=UPI0030164EDB